MIEQLEPNRKHNLRLRDRRRYKKCWLCWLNELGGIECLVVTELHHLDGITTVYNKKRIMELSTNSHILIHYAMEIES